MSDDFLLDAIREIVREVLKERDAIRLKHIKEMLGQLNQDATSIHGLMVEKKSIEEFLGEPA